MDFDDEDWNTVRGVRVLELPTPRCRAHRIVFAQRSRDDKTSSLLVTEFKVSKLAQIMDPTAIRVHKVRCREKMDVPGRWDCVIECGNPESSEWEFGMSPRVTVVSGSA